MADPAPEAFAGSGDVRDGRRSLADRFRRHADSLERSRRSPLYVEIMRGAARDIDSKGTTTQLFNGVPVPPGSVPALRLLAALHHLVLSGRAPQLATFYPSVGGDDPPEGVWPVALATLEDHADWVTDRLGRTVQTNDPGRACVLYAALLWLTDRYGLPIRLLELGASAGLNLHPDRFAYLVGGVWLGDTTSTVRLIEPWERTPEIDLAEAARNLRIVERGGCDLAPLDPAEPDDRLTLLSYIWPDESERLARTEAAIDLVAQHPGRVQAEPAGQWVAPRLQAASDTELTVIWHSLFRQYLVCEEWQALEASYDAAAGGMGAPPVVWLSMEPGQDHIRDVELTLRGPGSAPERRLARCGDHGPPLSWE